jgi:hypothetical protein
MSSHYSPSNVFRAELTGSATPRPPVRIFAERPCARERRSLSRSAAACTSSSSRLDGGGGGGGGGRLGDENRALIVG